MHLRTSSRKRERRRGAAAVEFAVLVPFLAFLFVIAVDYARIFYFSQTLENCARNGAYFASDYPGIYGYSSVCDAALADAPDLSPAPTVVTRYSSCVDGPFDQTTPVADGYAQVTVTWQFRSVTNFPGVPTNVTLSRAVAMQMAPITPSNYP